MKTLVCLLPQTDKHKHGTFRDIIIKDNEILRIFYVKENIGFYSRLKLKRTFKDCTVFDNELAEKLPCHKLRRDGLSLAFYHINEIIAFTAKKMPVVIFTSDISDLTLLEDSVKSLKNISILTTPPLYEEFDSFLLNNYGIAAAVNCAASLSGKAVIVMPSGSGFDTNGAGCVIDLNNSQEICKMLRFHIPGIFKNAGTFLKHSDMLETALDFFELPFSEAKISSVKFNK